MLILANIYGFCIAHWRIIGSCVLALVLFGAVLFGINYCSNYRTERQIDKAKANVNAATQELKQAHANLANAQIDEAVKIEKVKEAANAVVLAVNATEAGKVEIQTAANHLANVIVANKPSGTNEDDLRRRLDDLDIK